MRGRGLRVTVIVFAVFGALTQRVRAQDRVTSGTVRPLSYTLKTFLTCKTRDRIKFCLFLVMGSTYGRFADDEAYRAYAARLIAEPNYLKVEGNRPVISIGFLNDALVEKLADGRWQRFCGELAKGGAGKPYLVIGHGNPVAAKRYCARLGGEAVSDYNYSRRITREGMPFVELAAAAESFWERCETAGVSVVPICMAGFDWRPRAMSPAANAEYDAGDGVSIGARAR